MAEIIADKAKAVILIGQTAPIIANAIEEKLKTKNSKLKTITADSLSNAVTLANNLANPGDVVLLSPACASYDMFENYEQRGHQFTEFVKSL